MTRRDWLLIFVALDGDRDGLDPIRIQKGLFLVAQEGGLPTRERYWFVPYNYGPMSPRLYRDVDVLVRRGLLERCVVDGQSWRRIRATPAGRERARTLETQIGSQHFVLGRMRGIRRLVVGLDFGRLLTTIYERYPTYASRSVFHRP